jgi:hypothetical protein
LPGGDERMAKGMDKGKNKPTRKKKKTRVTPPPATA